jgi:hypothetical protein
VLDTIVLDGADDGDGQIRLRARSVSDDIIQVDVAYQAGFDRENNILILHQRYSRSFADSQSWHGGRFAVAETSSGRNGLKSGFV